MTGKLYRHVFGPVLFRGLLRGLFRGLPRVLFALCVLIGDARPGFTGPAAAAGPPRAQAAYSADAVLEINDRRIASKVFHDSGRERREFAIGGIPQVLILQPGRNRVVYLLPVMNAGMELILGEGEALPDLAAFARLKPRDLGREEIDGQAATRYDVERLDAEQPYTLTLWLTDDGIPLRAEASDTRGDYRLILSNVRRGPQDDALFEVPDGIRLAPVDAATLRGIFGG